MAKANKEQLEILEAIKKLITDGRSLEEVQNFCGGIKSDFFTELGRTDEFLEFTRSDLMKNFRLQSW